MKIMKRTKGSFRFRSSFPSFRQFYDITSKHPLDSHARRSIISFESLCNFFFSRHHHHHEDNLILFLFAKKILILCHPCLIHSTESTLKFQISRFMRLRKRKKFTWDACINSLLCRSLVILIVKRMKESLTRR